MLIDQQQIKHIKVIQQNESKSWVGLLIQFTQSPGMGNIHTNRKFTKMSEYFKVCTVEFPSKSGTQTPKL